MHNHNTSNLFTKVHSNFPPTDNSTPTTFVWGHGLMSSIQSEDDSQFLDFNEITSANVIRYDAIGHGQSPRTTSVNRLTWPYLAEDMAGIAHKAKAEQFIAGGASMGCATAIYTALKFPNNIQGLILVIPPTAWDKRVKPKKTYKLMARLSRIGLLVPLMKFVTKRTPIFPAFLRDKNPTAEQAFVKNTIAFCENSPAPVFYAASQSDLPPKSQIAKIKVPTLILSWEDDVVHPISIAEELHQLMDLSQLHIANTYYEVQAWPAIIDSFIADIASTTTKVSQS